MAHMHYLVMEQKFIFGNFRNFKITTVIHETNLKGTEQMHVSKELMIYY